MRRGRLPFPLAIIAAVAVAEVAVLALRPRSGVIEPAPVSVSEHFSAAEVDRARDFRTPQLWLYGGTLVIEGGLLAWLVLRPPAALTRVRRRPVVAAALAGAALATALDIAPLPVSVAMRERAKDVGLVTQSWGGYAGDVAKSWAIGGVLAGGGAALGIALMRRAPRRWWIGGAAAVTAFGVVMVYAGPVVLDPLFNRFKPLPAGQARADVIDLARRAGVTVGEVYEVDASRRTTAANAYVTGLGPTKRVVLYDTLLEGFNRDELRLVVAHELAHVKHRDVPNGLLFLALIAPFAMWAVARTTARLAPGEPGAATVPALAAAIALVGAPLTVVSNQLSRRIEARADSFSLTLTGTPAAFISFERGIALRNVADPDPPAWRTVLLSTHPPTLERIGIGVAYERGGRATGPGRRTRGGS